MIALALWRRNVGWLAGIVAFPLVWQLLGTYIRDGGQFYGVDLTAQATSVTFIPLTLVATLSAWEAVRVTPLIGAMPVVRRPVALVAALACGPAVIATLLAYWLAFTVRLVAAGVPVPLPSFTIALGVVTLHIAAALVGVAIGATTSSYLAAPMAGAAVYGSFILLGFASGGDLRLLYGQQFDCCAIDQAPTGTALAVPVLTAVAVGVVALVVLAWRWRRETAVSTISAIAGIALLLGSVVTALDAGETGTLVARDAAMTCRTSPEGIEVCVWPEHEHLLGSLIETGDMAFARWGEVLPGGVPTRITEHTESADAVGVLPVAFDRLADRDDIVAALTLGVIPQPPDCPRGWANGAAFSHVVAWLLLSADASTDHPYLRDLQAMTISTDEDPVAVAQRYLAAGIEEQRAWLDRIWAAFGTCEASYSARVMAP